MNARNWTLWVLLGCATGLASCAAPRAQQPPQEAQLVQAVSPPARLRPPETLSPVAQAILKQRMVSHAREMRDLVTAIVVLNYDEAQAGASRIAGDASLSRPLSQDATELNSALPEQFFVYQDALRTEAKTFAAAAAHQNPFEVADSYGRLSQVCVRCHATYRAGR
jgi:cytochrome c556